MENPLTADVIEARARARGMSMLEMCRAAGIAASTFTRWKAGKTEPTLGVYRRLCEVVGSGAASLPREPAPPRGDAAA